MSTRAQCLTAALAALLLAAPAAAQTSQVGAGVLFQRFSFDDTEAASVESISLMAIPFSALVRFGSRTTVGVSGMWANGRLEDPEADPSTIDGLVDTQVYLTLAGRGGATSITAIALIPTNLLSSKSDPGYSSVVKICSALGITPNQIAGLKQYSALSIDCPSKFLVPQLVAGVQLMFQPDIDHTDLVVAIGVNTVVSHGHGLMTPNPLGRIRALQDRGGKLVVVDPRRTETAHHADLYLPIRPGTDPALLAFAVRAVIEGGADLEFLDSCTDAASLDRLRDTVAPYDRDHTAHVTGLEPGDLERFESLIAGSGRLGIETGTGVSMSRSAMLTEWLAWALAGVTGSLDRRGGNTFNPSFLRPVEEAPPGGRGDLGPRPASRPDLPRIVNGEMPCAALADEIEAGHVRALIVRVGNPAMAFPDDRKLRRALERLDLLVVIDARHTATTALATHVLPIADHFERGDLLTGYLQAAPFLRWAPRVVEPIGERRPQWWIFAQLARALGYPLLGSERRDRVLAERDLDDATIAETLCHGARHPWSAVRDAPYGILDESVEPGWLIPDRLPASLDLAPAELVAAFTGPWTEQLPGPDQLVLINRRTSGQYNSLAAEVTADRSRHASPTLLMHPADAERTGLADGDPVVVTSDHGSCAALAELSEHLLAGVVSLPHAWPDSDVNRLTSDRDVDPLSAMPILSGFAVTVAAAPD